MGIRSRVLVNPENMKVGKYSSLCKFITKVNEVNKSNACIHLMGTVKEVFPVSPFTRSDNSTGKYMRLSLADETGEIPIVAWNEKAEALGKIAKVNSDLKLVNAKVKEKPSGKLEIHINSYTYFEVSDQPNF